MAEYPAHSEVEFQKLKMEFSYKGRVHTLRGMSQKVKLVAEGELHCLTQLRYACCRCAL